MRRKPDPAIIPLANRMFAEGVQIGEVTTRAKASRGTWSRWAGGQAPNLPTLRRMEDALEAILREEAEGHADGAPTP